MEQRSVRVGPLEIMLPEFSSGESIAVTGRLTAMTAVLLPGVGLNIGHVHGGLEARETFLSQETENTRPKKYEKTTLTLGGCRFDAHRLFEPFSEEGLSMTTGVADLFGDFVYVSWSCRVDHPDADVIETLIGSIVEGMVVRRQLTLDPHVLKVWVDRQASV